MYCLSEIFMGRGLIFIYSSILLYEQPKTKNIIQEDCTPCAPTVHMLQLLPLSYENDSKTISKNVWKGSYT